MENIKPGSILINSSTNKIYGVLVSILPNNKLIVFRLDKNTHPIFSKFDIHPHIIKVGNINEFQYSTLKTALLKYYRTYNLTTTEKQMLKPLMIFAFPLGIPEYKPDVELPERDIELMDLHSKLISGNRIMINTPQKSCYKNLDNKTVDIIEKNDNGVWVNLPTNETDISKLGNSMSFLFYKNREIPTFGGISRITPIYNDSVDKSNNKSNNTDSNIQGETNKSSGCNTIYNNVNDDKYNAIIEAFKKLKENNELTTLMEYNGDKVRLMPSTKRVIFPEVYQNMIYNPHTDIFTIEKENLTSLLANKLGNKLIISSKDGNGNLVEINGMGMDNDLEYNTSNNMYNNSNTDVQPQININEDGEIIYSGGGKKTQTSKEIIDEFEDIDNYDNTIDKYNFLSSIIDSRDSRGNIDDISYYDKGDDDDDNNDDDNSEYDSDDDLNLIMNELNSKRKRKLSNSSVNSNNSNNTNNTNSDTDYDEDDFEYVLDEDDIEEETIFEKVKKIEIDEVDKVYKESIQKGDLLKYKIEQLPVYQRNNEIKKKEIKKQINIISLIKNNITSNDNKYINFKPENYKPLVSKYIKGDFTNQYLIPLVLNRKKIYLNKDKNNDKDDYDQQSNEIIEDFYENISNFSYLQDKKNISLNNDVYTEKLIKELNPTSITEQDSIGMLFRLGDKLDSNDYSRLSQDTVTIKYCDKPMKCQSYGLNTMKFDYQVNLGPMGRLISPIDEYKDDNDFDDYDNYNNIEDDDSNVKNTNILYSKPNFKVYYPGDNIRIIGYVRPPLNYFKTMNNDTITNTINDTLLNNLYKKENRKENIITINLKDINPEVINEDNEEQFEITQHPDKFVIFLISQEDFNYNNIEAQIEKVIPTIDDILKLYVNKIESKNIDHIYSILNKFEYDYNELTIDIYNKIMKENDEIVNFYTLINNKLQTKFNIYQKNVLKKKKIKEENEKKFKNRIIVDKTDKSIKDESDYKYITNDIMDDITNFYFNNYDNKNIIVDSDELRLKWFENNFDNGQFLFKTLLINNLKMYQETHNIENLETELSIIKDKHIMMSNNAAMLGQSNQTQNTQELKIKNTLPNIIKYPTLERLEKDNGKVAIDSDGNVIMIGDYALVDVENTKQLFKREVIGNIDMWIKEDISILYKLIQDKRNNCIDNPELKLENESLYDFDVDKLKCVPKDAIESSIENLTENHKVELQINELQKEIDYIKNIPILIANINKEIINERMYLVNKVNSMKDYMKDKEAKDKLEEEKLKENLQTQKPCIHFDLVNHFNKLESYYEKYTFADTILKQFENNDFNYDNLNYNKDNDNTNNDNTNNIKDKDNTNNDNTNNDKKNKLNENINDYNHFNHIDNNKNFTFCNLCNQKLLCNHHKLIVNYFNKMKHDNENVNKIDYNKIINIYAVKYEGSYVCNACNIPISTTEQEEDDDFTKGEDGSIIKIREVTKEIPIIEKEKDYINKFIKKLYEDNEYDNDITKDVLKFRITIFNIMKELSNLSMLSIKDEVEVLNFLKSYQFEKKEAFLVSIQKKIGTSNLPLLKKLTDYTYLNYLISDIGARFLITLQTSSTNYKLTNNFNNKNIINSKYCNNTNIIGYPLINNIDEKDGIHYMMCLFSQMALLPEYISLNEKSFTEFTFIERIKTQIKNDNMVIEKLYLALIEKANIIEHINEFEEHYTNYWKEYQPRLTHSEINWSPDKLLNSANLKEITYKNYDKMINVGIENTIYYSLNVMNKINTVISNSEQSNKGMLLNNCCPEDYNVKHNFNYMDYFNKHNTDIPKNLNLLKEVSDILSKIKNISEQNKFNVIYEPLYKPSQIIFNIEFNISNDEVKDMYLKYIDSGLHKGKEHIYDNYGRCILSNVKKADIENQSYSMHDYKRIEASINSGNNVIIEKQKVNEISNEDEYSNEDKYSNNENKDDYINKINEIEEMEKIDDLIDKIPNLEVLTYLKDFFIKIKESKNDIFSFSNNEYERMERPEKHIKKEKFDIHKHLRNLTAIIDNEIDDLSKKIISTDKNINKYKKIMLNIGDFKILYDDYKTTNDNDLDIDKKSLLYRYTKKEEYIQFSIKYLNDVMNQIKHKQLSNPLNKEKIRPQYRNFLKFGEKDKLFTLLGETTRTIYNFVKIIKSKEKYKVLYPELICNVLHYLNIISLSNLFNILNNNKISKVESESIDYNFQIPDEVNPDLIQLNKELNLGLDDDTILDTEEDVNFIESIEIKSSDNVKTIYSFILSYLDYITINQSTYDTLSETYIKSEIRSFDQKTIERTLKQYKILKEENNEELRRYLYLQMNVYKRIEYSNLANEVEKLLDEGLFVSNQDSIDTYDETVAYNENYNPDNDYNYINEEPMGHVISADDDVGDQDYDAIAVDDD